MADAFEAQIVISAKDLNLAGLAKINENLKGIGASARQLDATPMSRLSRSMNALGSAVRSVGSFAATTTRNLAALGGLSAGAGLVAFGSIMRSAASSIDDVSKAARQVGLPIQEMAAFQQVAELAGVSAEAASKGLIAASKNFANLRAGIGRLGGKLDTISPGLSDYITSAKSEAEAYSRMLEVVNQAIVRGDEAAANQLAEMFFGSSDFYKVAEMNAADFVEAMEAASKLLGEITTEQGKNVEDFNDSLTDLGTAMRGLRNAVAADFLPALTPMIKGWTDWLGTAENRQFAVETISGSMKTMATAINGINWPKVGEGLKEFGNGLSKMADIAQTAADAVGGWPNLLAGLIGLKIANDTGLTGGVGAAVGGAIGGGAVAGAAKVGGMAAGLPAAGIIAGAAAIRYFGKDLPIRQKGPGWEFLQWRQRRIEAAERERELDATSRTKDDKAAPSWWERFFWGKAAEPGFNFRDRMKIGPDLTGVPQRALGGPMPANRWTLVGERGPELVQFPTFGQVYDADKTRAMLSPGGGIGADAREIGRALLAPARVIAAPFRPLGDLVADLNRTMGDLLDFLRNGQDLTGFGGGDAGGGGSGGGGFSSPSALTGAIRGGDIAVPANPLTIPQSLRDAALPLQGIGSSSGVSRPILDMISMSEGTTKRGYNDSFAHQFKGVLTNKTLDEIDQIQRAQRGSSAIGKYQMMRATMQEERAKLGLTGKELFDSAMQDRLAMSRLEFRGYSKWKAGRIGDQKFMSNLAHEWAGMTNPFTGRGVYPGQTTGFSIATQQNAIEAERRRISAPAVSPHMFAGSPMMPPAPRIGQSFDTRETGDRVRLADAAPRIARPERSQIGETVARSRRDDMRPAVRYEPGRQDGPGGRQAVPAAPASLGTGEVRVTVSDDRVSVKSNSRGQLQLKSGIDNSGQLGFRPGLQPRGGRPLTGGL